MSAVASVPSPYFTTLTSFAARKAPAQPATAQPAPGKAAPAAQTTYQPVTSSLQARLLAEATETLTQTRLEAASGDLQAEEKLAAETPPAAQPAAKGGAPGQVNLLA